MLGDGDRAWLGCEAWAKNGDAEERELKPGESSGGLLKAVAEVSVLDHGPDVVLLSDTADKTGDDAFDDTCARSSCLPSA